MYEWVNLCFNSNSAIKTWVTNSNSWPLFLAMHDSYVVEVTCATAC